MADEFKTDRHRILTVLAAIVLLNAAGYTWIRACDSTDPGIDFVQFRLAARHIHAGGASSLYSETTRQQILESAWQSAQGQRGSRFYDAVSYRNARSLELYSSPLLYAAFTIFPNVHYDNALRAYYGISIAATIVGCLGFGWWLKIPRASMLFAALMLLTCKPLHSDLRVGNVNQLQLGMLGVTLVLLWTGPLNFRDIAVAAWFALCLAFKPSLVWCVVLVVFDAWLAGRHAQLKRLAIGGFIGSVSAMILSMPWFTIRDWLEWSRSVWNLPDEIIRTEIGNISIAYTLIDQGLIPRWLPWLVSLALVTLAVVIPNRHRQRCGAAGDLSVDETAHTASILAIGCLIPLLMSRLVWYHYLVLAIPAILIIISRIENLIRRDRVQAVALTSLVLWSLLLLGIAPVDDYFSADAAERSVRVAFAVAFLLSMTLCLFPVGVSAET